MPPIALAPENGVSASDPRQARKYESVLSAERLATVVAKMRAWDPLVVDAVFDDLDRVIGDQTPPADQIDELGERLRGTLIQLGNIAVADQHVREVAQPCARISPLPDR